MKWIELNIKCNNESDRVAKMRELDIPIDDEPDTMEYRPFMLQSRLVDGFYPDTEGGCFVFWSGMELTVKENYNTLCKLIIEDI